MFANRSARISCGAACCCCCAVICSTHAAGEAVARERFDIPGVFIGRSSGLFAPVIRFSSRRLYEWFIARGPPVHARASGDHDARSANAYGAVASRCRTGDGHCLESNSDATCGSIKDRGVGHDPRHERGILRRRHDRRADVEPGIGLARVAAALPFKLILCAVVDDGRSAARVGATRPTDPGARARVEAGRSRAPARGWTMRPPIAHSLLERRRRALGKWTGTSTHSSRLGHRRDDQRRQFHQERRGRRGGTGALAGPRAAARPTSSGMGLASPRTSIAWCIRSRHAEGGGSRSARSARRAEVVKMACHDGAIVWGGAGNPRDWAGPSRRVSRRIRGAVPDDDIVRRTPSS